MAEILQAKKAGYPLDMEGFWLSDKFRLILPGASLAATRERADNLRQAAKTRRVNWQDQVIKSTTISLGVATFPDHGFTGTELIAAANAALYRAKQAGRDRVETAGSPSPAISAL